MKIQFNTGKNVVGSEELKTSVTYLLNEELSRFSHQITRLEVHLSDEDGIKDGQDDRRCMLEARLEGLRPMAVTDHANTYQQAVKGATQKMKTNLERILGRLKNY
jgi:ribosome-associated translation inhibitor RaiA